MVDPSFDYLAYDYHPDAAKTAFHHDHNTFLVRMDLDHNLGSYRMYSPGTKSWDEPTPDWHRSIWERIEWDVLTLEQAERIMRVKDDQVSAQRRAQRPATLISKSKQTTANDATTPTILITERNQSSSKMARTRNSGLGDRA